MSGYGTGTQTPGLGSSSPSGNPGYNPQYSSGYQGTGKSMPTQNPQEPMPNPTYGYRNRFQGQQLPSSTPSSMDIRSDLGFGMPPQGPQGNEPYGQQQFDGFQGGKSGGKNGLYSNVSQPQPIANQPAQQPPAQNSPGWNPSLGGTQEQWNQYEQTYVNAPGDSLRGSFDWWRNHGQPSNMPNQPPSNGKSGSDFRIFGGGGKNGLFGEVGNVIDQSARQTLVKNPGLFDPNDQGGPA